MNQGALKFIAALIGTVMVVLPFAGLDSLSRDLRSQIVAERSALTAAQTSLRTAQESVARDLQAEPDLFRAIPASQGWSGMLDSAGNDLQSAARDMDQLTALEKANRRGDRQRALTLLAHERQMRTTASKYADDIRKESAHWVDLKKRLPDVLSQMDRDYQAIRGFDFAPVASVIQKAGTDWPEKKADLDNRMQGVRAAVPQAESLWQSTAAARSQAAANNLAGLDFGALFAAAETLRSNAQDLPSKTASLQSLTGQLYVSWDKMLVDMRQRKNEFDQQIRTVTTKDGATTSDEKWITVSRASFQSMQDKLGMAIEHKSAGKFDSEADRVAQPAGFAYMAPPGQRNQYGYWEGNSWVFFAQYMLMRDLLFNRDYRPLDRGDWDGYRTRQSRGETYYGQDARTSQPKYGTQGTATQERYSGSSYSRSGGFKDSKYATKSGGYRDSEFASPNARKPGSDSSPRSFGSGSSGSDRRAVPVPSRPSPRPSSPRPSSAPRRFGKR